MNGRGVPAADLVRLLQQAAAAGSADDMLRAGATALQAGLHAEAVGPVEQALKRHGGNARLWQLLGLLHRNLDDLPAAIKAFGKAAALLPDDPTIVHGQAQVHFDAGLPSAHLFGRAARLAPQDRGIVLRRAAAQFAEGLRETAFGLIDAELRRDPSWLEGHAALARFRWISGERDRFARSFEQALAARPAELALWRAHAETLLNAHLYDRALEVIAKGRAAAGAHTTFDAAEAIARGELREPAADALFSRLAHVNNLPLTLHHLRYLIRAGRVKEAAAIAEKRAPGDPSLRILPYLSVAWRLLGDPRWEWLEGDPRFIGVYDIAGSLPPLPALADRLRTLHRAVVHHPFDQSLRGGTQTEGQLFPRTEPEIRALRRAVVAAVERHVAQLPPPVRGHPLLVQKRAPIRFAGSWSVRLTDGGRHVEHVHPAGWLSSALYVALPEQAEWSRDHAGWLSLGEASELGVDLPPIRLVEPKPGRLVLFPSTMWHGTRPFAAGERLTVAFDVKRPA